VIEKINMRCYGDKPASFMAKVGAKAFRSFVAACNDDRQRRPANRVVYLTAGDPIRPSNALINYH
jgi:hypothetical protein